MQKIVLSTVTIGGLIIGVSTIASASPTLPALNQDVALRTTQVEPVSYYYNHQRYKHRSWDRRHRRWRYY